MGIAASKLLMEQQQLDSSELGDTVEQVTRKLMECLGATFPKVRPFQSGGSPFSGWDGLMYNDGA